MAQSTVFFQVYTNSSSYFDDSATHAVGLYKGSTTYTGNVEVDGNFIYVGKGMWGIGVSESDSGVYTVKKSTDTGANYTEVTGLAKVPILMKDMLMLAGGTMTGDIAMASNEITGVNSLSFNDASGTINGISAKNLLDKTAAETIAGAWTHSGDSNFTGSVSISDPSKFKLGGISLDAALTGNDLNMLANLYTTGSKALTTAKSYGAVQTELSGDQTLTFGMAGVILYTTSGGNATCTLPVQGKGNAGTIFIIYLLAVGSYSLNVESNANDTGFALMTGALTTATGTRIHLDANNDFVILMCSGNSPGKWAILAGNNADLS